MKKLIGVALVMVLASNAWAEGEDLENCLYKNGVHIEYRLCNLLREEKAQDDVRRKRQAEELNQARSRADEQSANERAAKEARNKQLEREYAEEQAILKKRQDAALKEQEHEEAAQKRKCGKDYGAIRVGMAIDRLEECSGAVYVTETVTKGGVIETYRTMFDMVDVKDGKVVSYTKRTH